MNNVEPAMFRQEPEPAAKTERRRELPRNVRPRAWRALLVSEWFAHSRILLVFLGAWLVAVWTLPLFTHAGWVLLLGALYALIAGPIYGGGDVLEGCEEFTLALPPTRTERFLSRLAVGLGTTLMLCLMNIAALGLDLPQLLAGLFVKSGLGRPAPVMKPGVLYTLVLVLPVAVFSFAFTLSTLTHSRMVILLSWFWSALGALALLQIAFWYEALVWDGLNGRFACPLLMAASAAVLSAGFFFFRRKEVGRIAQPLSLPGLWWLWMLLFALGLGLAAALISSLSRNLPEFFR
jgi:hypothetical protein